MSLYYLTFLFTCVKYFNTINTTVWADKVSNLIFMLNDTILNVLGRFLISSLINRCKLRYYQASLNDIFFLAYIKMLYTSIKYLQHRVRCWTHFPVVRRSQKIRNVCIEIYAHICRNIHIHVYNVYRRISPQWLWLEIKLKC